MPPITEQSLPPKSPLCLPVEKGAKHLSLIENVRALTDKVVKKENAAAAHSSSQVFSSQVAWKGCVDATRGGYTKWKIHTQRVRRSNIVPKPNSQRIAFWASSKPCGVGQRRIHSCQHLQSGAP